MEIIIVSITLLIVAIAAISAAVVNIKEQGSPTTPMQSQTHSKAKRNAYKSPTFVIPVIIHCSYGCGIEEGNDVYLENTVIGKVSKNPFFMARKLSDKDLWVAKFKWTFIYNGTPYYFSK